jgi:hypothetical protein
MAETLSPFGENILEDNHATAWTVVSGAISDYFADAEYLINLAEIAEDVFNWGDYPAPNLTSATDQERLRINEIQNTLIAQQPLEPAKCSLDPVETGEPGLVYWAGGAEKAALLAQPTPILDPASGQPMADAATGQPALQPGLVMLMPQEIGEIETIDPMTGQTIKLPQQPVSTQTGKLLLDLVDQGVLEEADVAEISDQSTAKFFQKPLDVLALRSRTNTDLDELWIKKAIAGYTPMLYEFDDRQKKHVHTILNLRSFYMDPTVTRLDKSPYAGVIRVLPKDEAIRRFPKYAAKIAEVAGQTPQQVANVALPAAYQRTFNRDMVTVVTHWQRDVEIPLSEQEATEGGQVSLTQIPMGQQVAEQPGPDGMPMMQDVVREAYVGGDGQEVEIDAPNWPTRLGILQLTLVDGVVIEEKECETWDIPLVLCPHIPMPGKPFGGSGVIKLWSAQKSLTTVLESIRKNSIYYGAPTLHTPRSTYAAMKEAGLPLHTKPGGIIIYEDDVWAAMGGKPPQPTPPPDIPTSQIQAEAIFRNTVKEDSSRSDAARGNLPSAQVSGKTVGLLLQANNTANEGVGKGMLEALYRLYMLHLHTVVTRLSVDDIWSINSTYPKNIVAIYLDWAHRVEWNVAVSIALGGSQLAMTKQQNAMAKYGGGVQSLTTTQLEMEIDPEQENRRQEREMKRQARLQAQFAPPVPPKDEPEKKPKE